MSLRRPYGTLELTWESTFPTLKRGANKRCASGALIGTSLVQPPITPDTPQLFVVMQQAEDVVLLEALAALQEIELDGKAEAGNHAA